MPRKKNIDNISELRTIADHKKELARLKREVNAAYKTIEKLLKDGQKKEEEISHLKNLLNSTVPIIKPETKSLVKLDLTPEEEIAEMQLNKLRESAKNRKFTLEEARIYDLLVKNKRLSQQQSTMNIEKTGYRDVTDIELLEIASGKDKKNK